MFPHQFLLVKNETKTIKDFINVEFFAQWVLEFRYLDGKDLIESGE